MRELGASIVVCTLNRGRTLVNALTDLIRQSYQPLEIIVVDQSDQVAPEVKEFLRSHGSSVRHFHVSFKSLPKARNFGWQQARYSHVIYVDDDIRCTEEFASQHMLTYQNTGCALVAGGVDQKGTLLLPSTQVGKFSYWRAVPMQGFSSTESKEVDHAVGCNFSADRAWLEKMGGFDERFGKGAALYEEADFCLRVRRAGGRIQFNGKARLNHLADPTGGCRVDNVVDYVRSLARNRSLIIFEHLSWYYRPTAFLQLAKTVFAYAWRYRNQHAVWAACEGVWTAHRIEPRAFESPQSERGAA